MTFIDIKSEERSPSILLFFMFFSVVAASITGATVRDAVFLIKFDKTFLSVMFVIVALFMAIIISVYKQLSSGSDLLKILVSSNLLFMMLLFLFQLNLNGWWIPGLYLCVEMITILSILQFWILAGEIFNARQAKRIFTILGAGGSLAGIGAGYGIKPFVSTFGSNNLLYLTIIFISISTIIAIILNPYRNPIPKTSITKQNTSYSNKSPWAFDPYMKSIALMIGLSAFISKIVDYQFKIVAASSFPIQDDLVNFFGSYYMITGGATLIMQLFVTSAFLNRFGIISGLFILPITLALGSAGFLILGTLTAVYIAKFSDQVFKFSINNTIQEILWLPVVPEKKLKRKPTIDGTIRSIFEGMAGIFIFALVSFNLIPDSKIYLLSFIVLIGILIWGWNNYRLNNGYISSLMEGIEKRQLNLDEIQFDVNDSHTIKTIKNALNSKDELKQLFVIDLLWTLPLYPWKESLNELFNNGTSKIKRGVLELAWHQNNIINNRQIIELIKNKDDLTPLAISCASDRNIIETSDLILSYLESSELPLKASATISILKNDSQNSIALKSLNTLLNHDEESIINTLTFLKGQPHLIPPEKIKLFLNHHSLNIRNEILSILKKSGNKLFIDDIFNNLSNPTTNSKAEQALLYYPNKLLASNFSERLNPKFSSFQMRIAIIKFMQNNPNIIWLEILIKLLKEPDLIILNTVCDALISISKNFELEQDFLDKIDDDFQYLAQQAFQLHKFKKDLKNDSDSILIHDHIESDLNKITPILLKLGTLDEPEIPIETYIQYLKGRDLDLMPLVLELVDSTFSTSNRRVTLPLIDPDTDAVKSGEELFPDMISKSEDMLIFWAENYHKWKSAISIKYLIQKEKINILESINFKTTPKSIFKKNYFNETEQNYLNNNLLNNKLPLQESQNMYSILEKTIFLKSVDLFKNISGDILNQIAQISTEINYDTGHNIFSEGENGDSMFLIMSGKVNIIQNGKTITELKDRQCIGEMAILDNEPRSADAVTSTETILLKIEQNGFYELMASNKDIMQEIVQMLIRRLRNMNKQLTESYQ